MKITFMGTSHGYAEMKRFTSATLIETEQASYLLDAGGPVEWLMVNNNKPFDRIRGIFITHMHNDHAGNLTAVIEPMLRFRYNDKGVCFMPDEAGKQSFIDWMCALKSKREMIERIVDFRITTEGKIFDNDDISVSAKPTCHLGDNGDAYSYIFEKDGKKVFFTGDMSQNFTEYKSITGDEHYDLVVCEMAHANLSDVAEILKTTNTDRMIITHYHTPRIENHEEIFKSFPFPVCLAFDGMEINL